MLKLRVCKLPKEGMKWHGKKWKKNKAFKKNKRKLARNRGEQHIDSLLYFSRKLCIYNLCIDEAFPPKTGFYYCWSEVEGNRGSNEIGTCMHKWLEQLPSAIKEVFLFSDTCGGQNRNQNVAALLLYEYKRLQLKLLPITSWKVVTQ